MTTTAYDREERKSLPFTPLHPDCNYLDIMEQHLQLLALGRPILKPVYDHATGTFHPPEYVEPKRVRDRRGAASAVHQAGSGLLRRHRLPRAARGDSAPLEDRARLCASAATRPSRSGPTWSGASPSRRRTSARSGSTPTSWRGSLRSQRATTRPSTPLSAELMLRPTIQHPSLSTVLTDDNRTAMHLKILRDADGTPTDCLHVHGHASAEEARQLEKAIWAELDVEGGPPDSLGRIGDSGRSEPLAITQLILLYHLLSAGDGRSMTPLKSGEAPQANLGMDLVRVTEAAAMASGRWVGRGDKDGGDGAAVDAMRALIGTVAMNGVVVIGEGEKDHAPMLFNGERGRNRPGSPL